MDKLAIFDLDGTLFNTNRVNYHAYKEALIRFGYNLEYSFYADVCNGKYYKEFLPLIVKDTDKIEEIHQLKKDLYCKYLDKAVPNRHLFTLIDCLKDKYYIALVTTASRINSNDILDFYKVRNKFDLLITQEDVGKMKPDPEGFLKAMRCFNVSPENTIIFEDSIDGIQAAVDSGACVMKVEKIIC